MLYSLITGLIILALCWTALPVARILRSDRAGARILVFPIGFLLHSIVLSILAFCFGLSGILLIAYCFIVAVAFLWWQKTHPEAVTESSWERIDSVLLSLWIVLTLLVVSLPYLNVGTQTEAGLAYRAYFNADFFRNMAVAETLSRSGIPPVNPYLAGETLHYYWFFHIIPAYLLKLFPSLRTDHLLVVFSLLSVCMFTSVLFYIVRCLIRSRKTLLFLFPVFAFGGSYKAIYILRELYRRGMTWREFTAWNIDGILRWHWNAPQIDSLFRALLYAPQHLLALCVFLIAIPVWISRSRFAARALLCVLIFASIGLSTFVGAVLVMAGGIAVLIGLLQKREQSARELLVWIVTGIAFLFLYFPVFEMFQTGAHRIAMGLDPAIKNHFFPYLVLNWGPLLLLGLAGLVKGTSAFPRTLLLAFLLFCFLVILFTKLDLPGGSDISLKLGHFSHVVLLLLCAAFLDWIVVRFPSKGLLLALGLFVLLLPAAGTWMMDAYNSRDVSNPRFTTYVTPDEQEALSWMKTRLASNSIILNYSKDYENFVQDKIPPLAGRPVYLGNRIFALIFQVNESELKKRKEVMKTIFREADPANLAALLRAEKVDYIFVGSNEGKDESILSRFAPPGFSLVFQEGKNLVFRVEK